MTALAMDPSVQVAAVSTAGTVAIALVGIVVELLRRQSLALGEVREQVANSHQTNLRDDLDAVRARLDLVLDGQDRHERALTSLHEEIAHERRERLAVAERLDDHIAANAADTH